MRVGAGLRLGRSTSLWSASVRQRFNERLQASDSVGRGRKRARAKPAGKRANTCGHSRALRARTSACRRAQAGAGGLARAFVGRPANTRGSPTALRVSVTRTNFAEWLKGFRCASFASALPSVPLTPVIDPKPNSFPLSSKPQVLKAFQRLRVPTHPCADGAIGQ